MMDSHVAWEICFASSFSVCVDLLIFFFFLQRCYFWGHLTCLLNSNPEHLCVLGYVGSCEHLERKDCPSLVVWCSLCLIQRPGQELEGRETWRCGTLCHVIISATESFWRWLGDGGRAFMNGISAWEDTVNRCHPTTTIWTPISSPISQSADTILGFPV